VGGLRCAAIGTERPFPGTSCQLPLHVFIAPGAGRRHAAGRGEAIRRKDVDLIGAGKRARRPVSGCWSAGTLLGMEPVQEVEFIFEPQQEGGYHVYAPELPGLHTQGDTLEEATESAREALELYVDGLREDGRSLEMGIVRRTLPLPA